MSALRIQPRSTEAYQRVCVCDLSLPCEAAKVLIIGLLLVCRCVWGVRVHNVGGLWMIRCVILTIKMGFFLR